MGHRREECPNLPVSLLVLRALRLECEKSKGIDSFFPKHFDTVANLSLDVVRWITTTEMKSAQV